MENGFQAICPDGIDSVVLDVRPILERGMDPYDTIMETLSQLGESQGLVVINSFEPIPLIQVLKEKGYEAITQRTQPGVVATCFFRSGVNTSPSDENRGAFLVQDNPKLFEEKFTLFAGMLKEVDVRQLEMPMPMAVILEELESLPNGQALFVHHHKFPQFLLDELAKRGFSLVSRTMDVNYVQLFIFR